MTDKIELDFGTISLFDNFLICECKEGILLDTKSNKKLLEVGRNAFGQQAFGYISNRINSYAVDPMVYRDAADHPQLKAIAVVSSSKMARQSALIEQNFYVNKNSFQIFSSLEEAKDWMKGILEHQSIEKSLNL